MANLADLRRRAEAWSAGDPDPQTAREIRDLLDRGSDAQLLDRFGGSLEFGTAGLRGQLGAGPNRMNRAVVRRTTAGLARYLKSTVPDAPVRGVVIGRDARRMSQEFAQEAAAVLAAEGIPALFFEDPVPTPVAAFATTYLNAAGAAMITASHNPPQYNGYKVYWGNGAQIIPPHDQGIASAIDQVEAANRIAVMNEVEARGRGLWRAISNDVGRAYLKGVAALRTHPEINERLAIAYTALHGVGGAWFEAAIGEADIAQVHVVPQQHAPDPDFPTVSFPNPEEPGAMDLSQDLAERIHADLVLANDPDADRLAVMARDGEGILRALSGDEVGVLLGHYQLTQAKRSEGRPLVISTIVSSAQLGRIAHELGALYDETLTGFKWIANRALEFEREEGARFLFGYEEALGYTVGTLVRDKDGIGAAIAFADLACWCCSRGLTPWEYLEEIQRHFGIYATEQKNFTFAGSKGAEVITAIMEGFRRSPPSQIGELPVLAIHDYLTGQSRSGGQLKLIRLPSSNVIAYDLAGGSRVTLRPSGTEPKIKYYFELKESLNQGEPLSAARERSKQRLRRLQEAFIALARERGHLFQT